MRVSFLGRSFLAASLAVVAATAAGADEPTVDRRGPERDALQAAIRRVYPALVRIHVVAVYYNEGREVKAESAGSGVIISPDGYVVTNHHVAGKVKRIQCTLSDKEEVEATLVGTDPLADIAVIKLDLAHRVGKAPLAVATFGDSDALKVGDTVMAMGCPLAISQSVTVGIVSNTEMQFPALLWPQTFRLDGEETGSLVRWIGHDAQIFPGNSGGPLVNLAGEIVGINEISYGLAGAIPANLAREVARQLVDQGEVRRSWLGLELQPLLKKAPGEAGALVSGVVADSPAEKAGLAPGDILLSYQGSPVAIRYSEQLPLFNRRVLETPIGTTVALTYARDGHERRATATTVARGSVLGSEAEATSWGVTLRELTLLAAKELKREPGSGVVVSSVRPGAPAAEAKPALKPGDIVVEVGGKPVRAVRGLLDTSHALTAGKAAPVPVLVAFERGSERLLTVVKLGDRDARDRSAEATKAWIPAASQVLTPDLAEALGLKGQKGVRLTQIYPGAATALKVGDVLLKLDGEVIAASQPEETEIFPAMVRQYPVGAKVKLDVVRDGKPMALEVALEASPPSTRSLVEYSDVQFDFSARDLAFQDRMHELVDEKSGALITRVESGGWAALAHLAVGDIVLSVNGETVPTAEALGERMKQIAGARTQRVVFLVRRGVHTLFLELEPTWAPA